MKQFVLHNVARGFFSSKCFPQQLCPISRIEPVLDFTLCKLWSVISPVSQSRLRHRCFPSFFKYYLICAVNNLKTGVTRKRSMPIFSKNKGRLSSTCCKTNSSQSKGRSSNFIKFKILLFVKSSIICNYPGHF